MNEELKIVEDLSKRPIDRVRENFHIFGVASIIYAIFYVCCMYKNHSGVTYIIFTVGTVLFIGFILKKMELSLKKGSIFYIISMILVAISTFCTDDGRIIAFNKIAILLLVICLLLDAVYDTKKWGLGKFLSSIAKVCLLSIGEILSPFEHLVWYIENKWNRRNNKYMYLLLGIGITIPIFFLVFMLLSSADAVFRELSSNIIEGINFFDLECIIIVGFLVFMASYCVLVFMSRKSIDETVSDTPRYESLVAIPVALVMTMLYLVFSVIQIMYLFIGDMELPTGYTYAEYAREGFFQLLIVSMLNLIIVLAGLHFFKSSKILKGILAVMSACTIIMIVSSAIRMLTYIQYYYLTFLRILVLWSLLVLLLVFAGVIIYTFYKKFPLFRYSMVVVTALYIVLAFLHPDYLIAKVNLAGTEEVDSDFFVGEAYDDFSMIASLSADAAPAVVEWMETSGYAYEDKEYSTSELLFDEPRRCGSYYISNVSKNAEKMGVRGLNMSLLIAKNYIEGFVE